MEKQAKKPRAGRWGPGVSGNPAGRKPGNAKLSTLRASIAEHIPEIVARLLEQSMAGDTAASRLLLERVLPPVKPMEQTVSIDLPKGTLTDQGKAILAAAGVGLLAPGQAAQLLSGLGALATLVKTDELTARVAALEERNGQP